MVRFSRRGERATEFERTLVAGANDDMRRETSSLFLGLARRIGVDALLAVFDEIGGEKVHVPTRESFFTALWQVERDAEIHRRLASGESPRVIADDFGLACRTVRHIRQSNRTDDVAATDMVEGRA